jgi:hypothetical protein
MLGAPLVMSGFVEHGRIIWQLDLARALGDGPRARELERTVARLYAVLSRVDLALSAALVPPHQR